MVTQELNGPQKGTQSRTGGIMGTLSNAAASGDRLQALIALRDVLARQIEETDSSRDVAALSRQLVDVLNEISEIPSAVAKSPADEIAERRLLRRQA